MKVGIIGCGWITSSYKLISKLIKNTKIVAATDLDIKKAIKIGGKNHAYTDIQKMYDSEEFDVTYIATPHHLHKPMIKHAFDEGKHVFCEKPVAISVEEAREIRDMDKKFNNLKLGFNYMYRYDHNCYNLASGIQNGQLGKVYYANCDIFIYRDRSYYNKGPWRAKKEKAGGGTLLIYGSHIIDIMLWAMGEPVSVMGKIDNMRYDDADVEDLGFGIVELENGARAQINCSSLVKPGKDLVKLHIIGEKGHCQYKGPWPKSKLNWKGAKKYKIEKNTKAISHIGRSIKAFGEWIQNDKTFLNTVEESSRALRLLSALYKSSETGKKEKVEQL